jgi:hypothetical protein
MFIADYALDGVLDKVAEATRLDLCTTEPTTYAQATGAASVGNKTGISFGAAGDRTPNGRKRTVAAITGGSVTGNGTGAFYALTDPANSRLLATGPLAASQVVTSGNTFNLAAFDVGIPDAA